MRCLLSVIGEPGVGKSTAVGAMWHELGAHGSTEAHDGIVWWSERWAGSLLAGLELGRDRIDYPGTDALPYNVMPAACRWIADRGESLIVAEGERLAHDRFYAAAARAGRRVIVVRLVADTSVVAGRRLHRPGDQTDVWVRGRRSRVDHLAAAWNARDVNAVSPPEVIGKVLALIVEEHRGVR